MLYGRKCDKYSGGHFLNLWELSDENQILKGGECHTPISNSPTFDMRQELV